MIEPGLFTLLLTRIEESMVECDRLYALSDDPHERARLSMAHVSMLQAAHQIRECLIVHRGKK